MVSAMDDRHQTGASGKSVSNGACGQALEWITKEAVRALSAPLATIAVPGAYGPRVLARAGRLAPFGLGPALTLLEQAKRCEGALCIENTATDAGNAGMDWRVGGHRIGSYAGHAVRDQGGRSLGVLAVLDRRKRYRHPCEREALAALSLLASHALAGRTAMQRLACMNEASTTHDDTDVCVLMLDLDDTQPTSPALDALTWQRITNQLPEVITRWLRDSDVVERLTDDTLMLLIRGDETAGERVAWRLHHRLSGRPFDMR